MSAAPTHAPSPERAAHDLRVAAIAGRLRELAALGEPVHIDKGGVHHVVPLPGDPRFRTRPVDVSTLGNVLSVDPATRTCVAEPGVSFADLVRRTLALGLVPKVVPELEGITLGGAVAGCSVESMSFRYGGFHDGCREYEVVTGEGDVLSCSPDHDPELFHMVHGSYGTLGILTLLTFDLVPAKPYVRLEYRTHRDAASFHAELLERCREGDFDFVDGIVHARDRLVLCLGRFVDDAPTPSNYRGARIYWKSTGERTTDVLTTFDYLFRYDTECHWLTRTVPPLEWAPVRLAVGRWFLGSTNLIRWSGRLAPVLARKRRPEVVVDVFVPARRFPAFFEWYARDFRFFPLWVVPYALPTPYPWVADALAARMGDPLMIDCAVYGKPNSDPDVDWSKVIEDKTFELDGLKTLISRNHYTPERFWQIYDRPRYEAVKRRVDPRGVFRDVFTKFHRVG